MKITATCINPNCHHTDNVERMVRVYKNDRGGLYADAHGMGAAYLCPYCASRRDSYYAESTTIHGKVKANNKTYGVEFESMADSERARIEFLGRGWLATSDSTVAIEYKTAIYRGLNALSKDCETVERLNATGDFNTIHSNCGTHLNIGDTEHINEVTVDYIRRFCNSLFVPLTEAMEANRTATAELFGRALGGWACGYSVYTSASEHRNFINLQHDNRIEFRICKFISAKQYMKAAKCCTEMVDAIINNFILHFNDEPKDSTRYPNKTSYRKHKAQVTAQKLVKIYNKYISR